ncbi:type II toxin-antitoxin system RelE/ParE family toxin [Xenorhabdus innexi]|uniref:Phage derived protein, Gp49-like n=1 Tax=Xenorhabdus innexi TaxID=290109 RepID=A0A1N6MS91_9GAMM|nr:type II toxin-antitoxin system RelE/ParE family toxin [Xenorhabdus innexi]PHM38599.1 phage derived protein, Gp49-like [Xenorhabdus innexi]SIP71609.1 Toxin-antitoxin system, toxin component, RelE family [Xenorhabdus innexi]
MTYTVSYHPEAEVEAAELPLNIKVKYDKVVEKLEADPTKLREPHTKPLGDGLFELRTMGTDIARGIWVYQSGRNIIILRVFIKKSQKVSRHDIELAKSRLEELLNETKNA